MSKVLEILLGLERGFLSREGDLSLQFHSNWPFADILGNAAWNLVLVVAAVALVIWIYNREGKSRRWRVILGAGRLSLLLLLIALLNRPALTLTRAHIEPSVLAVLIDDSVSMRVRDVEVDGQRKSRLEAAIDMLSFEDAALLRGLDEKHELRFFRFNRQSVAIAPGEDYSHLAQLEPTGAATSVAESVRSALAELQGQNLAGVLLLTDGKDAPARPEAAALASVRQSGARLYPVPIGGTGEPRNIEVQSVAAQDVAFAGDIVNIVASVRAAGTEGAQVRLALKDRDGNPVLNPNGQAVTATAQVPAGRPTEMELQLETLAPGVFDFIVEAEPDATEVDDEDNRRPVQIEVMDAQIAVLYVEGYARWEYKHLMRQIIRDSTINASILLTSADPTFAQEGNTPIQRFPVTIDELLDYDVVLLGDVSPQQFSDGQLQLLEEFVGDKGGGFSMIAGPRDSPWSWRGTPVERLLPVEAVAHPTMTPSTTGGTIAEGFRPVLTDAGREAGMFRFEASREDNEAFLATGIQPLFWFADGIIAKPGVGEVFAHHPTASAPDGRPAPLVVAGRYGAGRTVFNAMDESWRWRYYTGEHVFDTFWVQQLRYLARGRKLGQRRMTLAVQRPTYELGEQIQVELRLLDPALAQQLPDRLDLEVRNQQGQPVQTARLIRRGQGAEADRYTASIPATRVGNFSVALPPMTGEDRELTAPVTVEVPQLELDRPIVDRASLQRLAEDTGGRLVPLSEVGSLPDIIPSAERRIPLIAEQALWDAPLALVLFVLVITLEWVGRKMAGLI